jgi:cytoskeletal protein CcmA (bactofilin family)
MFQRIKVMKRLITVFGITLFLVSFMASVVKAESPAPVDLGTAGNYAILTKTGVTCVPPSAITGDIGISPIAATGITGFSLTVDSTNKFAVSSQVTGKVYASSYAAPTPSILTTAISNMETAYTDAAGRTPDYIELHTGDLSGQTLLPGVYKWSTSVLITSNVTLHGGVNDVFIFQIAKGISQAAGTQIILTGGVQARNLFWQASESVSIGTGAHFEGILLAKTGIVVGANASINGRLLAQTAATLIKNTVVAP